MSDYRDDYTRAKSYESPYLDWWEAIATNYMNMTNTALMAVHDSRQDLIDWSSWRKTFETTDTSTPEGQKVSEQAYDNMLACVTLDSPPYARQEKSSVSSGNASYPHNGLWVGGTIAVTGLGVALILGGLHALLVVAFVLLIVYAICWV